MTALLIVLTVLVLCVFLSMAALQFGPWLASLQQSTVRQRT